MTLEDVANQLLLPILGNVDLTTLELSSEEEAVEAELKKMMNENAKLFYWVSSSSKFSVSARHVAFVVFWLCKFVFGSHPHYAIKSLYFCLAIKIAAGVSVPLAPMYLGHLYVKLDILQSDERQAGSYHIVTSSVHSTILQHLLYKCCAKHLLKCRPSHFAKDKYQSRVGLKPIGHSAVESFDQGVRFSWRAYKNLGIGYTCVDFAMGLFVDIAGTTAPLTGFDEAEITYSAATNAGWLPYLADEGMRFVHYPVNRVRRQFGLD